MIYATLLLALAASPDVPKLDYSTSWVGNSFGRWSQVGPEQHSHDRRGRRRHGVREQLLGRIGPRGRCLSRRRRCGAHGGHARLGPLRRRSDRRRRPLCLFRDPPRQRENGRITLPGFPPKDVEWYGVGRRNKDGSHAPFPGGNGDKGDLLIVSSAPPKATNHAITGLAVSQGELFVSDPSTEFVRVYRTSDMTEVRHWEVAVPRRHRRRR